MPTYQKNSEELTPASIVLRSCYCFDKNCQSGGALADIGCLVHFTCFCQLPMRRGGLLLSRSQIQKAKEGTLASNKALNTVLVKILNKSRNLTNICRTAV